MGTEAGEALRAVARFVIHTFVGAALFATIALAAFGLHHFVKFLEHHESPDYVVTVLQAGEIALFGIDAALFALFVGKEVIILSKQLCGEIMDAFKADKQKPGEG